MQVRRMTLIPLAPNQVNFKFCSNSFKYIGRAFFYLFAFYLVFHLSDVIFVATAACKTFLGSFKFSERTQDSRQLICNLSSCGIIRRPCGVILLSVCVNYAANECLLQFYDGLCCLKSAINLENKK